MIRCQNQPSCHYSLSHHAGDWSYGSCGPGGAGSKLLDRATGTKLREQGYIDQGKEGGGGHRSQPVTGITAENRHARQSMPESIVPHGGHGHRRGSRVCRWRGIGWRLSWGGTPADKGNNGARMRTGRPPRAIGRLPNRRNLISLKWPGFDNFCMLNLKQTGPASKQWEEVCLRQSAPQKRPGQEVVLDLWHCHSHRCLYSAFPNVQHCLFC